MRFLHADLLDGIQAYVLAVIEHATSGIRILGVTLHPTGTRTAQQARNLITDLGEQAHRVKLMIRDRGSNYTAALDVVLTGAGIRTVLRNVRTPSHEARYFQVDLDPAEFGRSIPERAGLYGDVRTVLRKLLEALRAGAYGLTDGGVPFSGDPRVREIERCVRRIDEEADAWLSCDKVPINPFRVIWAARLVFPRETTVATDVGCLTPARR